MNAVGFIFARGGSKGLPGKNIRPLAGKPLIAWAIECAKSVQRIRRVIVSTDSDEIASTALKYGAEVPFMRPANLAEDNSSEWMAWRHALNYLNETEGCLPEAMVSVPTTAPLRMPEDVENCLNLFSCGDVDTVITTTDAHRNPWFNMVKTNTKGMVELIISPNSDVFRRQDAPQVYDVTTIAYVAKPEFVMANEGIFDGCVRAVQVPVERSIDIDTLLDFEIAEFLMKRKRTV